MELDFQKSCGPYLFGIVCGAYIWQDSDMNRNGNRIIWIEIEIESVHFS